MNKIIIKFLLTGDKIMPEWHFKQPRFTYSGSERVHHRERIKKNREAGNLKHFL